MIVVNRDYNESIGMNITDKYVGILVSSMWLSFNGFIIQFNQPFNFSFSECIHNLYIYSVYNEVNGMNISDN